MSITLDRVLRNIWSQSVFEPFLLGLFRSESQFTIRSTVPEILDNYMFLIQLSNYSLLPSASPWPPISKWTPSFCSPGHSKQVTHQHFVNRWLRSWVMINTSFNLLYVDIFISKIPVFITKRWSIVELGNIAGLHVTHIFHWFLIFITRLQLSQSPCQTQYKYLQLSQTHQEITIFATYGPVESTVYNKKYILIT